MHGPVYASHTQRRSILPSRPPSLSHSSNPYTAIAKISSVGRPSSILPRVSTTCASKHTTEEPSEILCIDEVILLSAEEAAFDCAKDSVMAASRRDFAKEYPLHWPVWHNDVNGVKAALEQDSSFERLEKTDPRKRTPLMLAVTLGHAECARLLLSYNADASAENAGFWAVSHEAVCTGDPELLLTVLQYRDYQRVERTRRAMSNLLVKLQNTPDFYAEMRWEFSSWVPFVSKLCPSDTYKIYKRGASVRIDTTLVGFDSSSTWQRGNQSFVFTFVDDVPQLAVIDHDKRDAFVQTFVSSSPTTPDNPTRRRPTDDPRFVASLPTEEAVVSRLTAPVVTTYVDVDRIGFERSKAGGLLGWISGSERTENVAGFTCKVYGACNVDLVTKTRTEHLSDADKSSVHDETNPMESILRFVQRNETKHDDPAHFASTYGGIAPEDYFDASVNLNERDIGRPKLMTRRSSSFKATLWLCDDFPLSLQEQVTPIIDLMAASNAHFARLKNFIELQLPAGFPVKIEIPLFHVVSARITFGNVNASERAVASVSTAAGSVDIDPTVFHIPDGYRRNDAGAPGDNVSTSAGRLRYGDASYEDDMYLQFALQQSLLDGNGGSERTVDLDYELQRAISESLRLSGGEAGAVVHNLSDDFAQALEVSKREEEDRNRRLREQEEEELRKAIALSLNEM